MARPHRKRAVEYRLRRSLVDDIEKCLDELWREWLWKRSSRNEQDRNDWQLLVEARDGLERSRIDGDIVATELAERELVFRKAVNLNERELKR